MSTGTALRYGLIHEVARNEEALDQAIANQVKELKQCGTKARVMAKKLIQELTIPGRPQDELIEMACQLISNVRISEEGGPE